MRRHRGTLLPSLLVALALLLAGCTGETSGPSPSASGTSGGQREQEETTAEELTEELLAAEPEEEPIATVAGTVAGPTGDLVDVIAEVLAVEATESGTRLRWRLRSAGGEPVEVRGFSLAAPPYFDTRAIALADAEGNQLLLPYTYQRTGTDLEARTSCLCSTMPDSVGDSGEEMDALFPPLSESTSSVEVRLPGFEVATGIEVTRR